MPKLKADQIIARLERRIAELEAGDEIAKKHILALLNDAQQQALEDALAEQVQLKQDKRARTEDEKNALGWKTIREVRLEVLKQALITARDCIPDSLKKEQRAAQVRQMRIYMDAMAQAKHEGKDLQVAKNWANNELTRAGLARLDGQSVAHQNKRDREVIEMEDALRAQFKSAMTADELEQQKMLEDLERSRKSGKSSGTGKAKK
jgi:hypothetical protein